MIINNVNEICDRFSSSDFMVYLPTQIQLKKWK